MTPLRCLLLAAAWVANTALAMPQVLVLDSPGAVAAQQVAVHRDHLGDAAANAWRSLPAFSARVLLDAGRAVPVHRQWQDSDHPAWRLRLGVGTVTTHADGRRLDLPLALQERGANCTHRGRLHLNLPAHGRPRASWRIDARTCPYFAMHMVGELPGRALQVRRAAADPRDQAALSAWQAWRGAQLPRLPVDALEQRAPGTAAALAPRTDGVSAWGVVLDGVHYASHCTAPEQCTDLALPSYSLAKALVGGLGLGLVEAAVPGTRERLLLELVPECRGHGWSGVRLDHLADMVSGHWRDPAPDADESASLADGFFHGSDHSQRLAFACQHWPQRAPPGVAFTYRTTDSYLLGTALQRAWQAHAGDHADIYRDLLVRRLWQPLGLSDVTGDSLRSSGAARVPLTGWGLTLLPEDLARIGHWLATGSGPALPAGVRAALLHRDPATAVLAYPASAASGAFRYNDGVWALDVGNALGCRAPLFLPFLSGYGGITLLLLPDGRVWYTVADSGEHRWLHAARALHQLQPLCETVDNSVSDT